MAFLLADVGDDHNGSNDSCSSNITDLMDSGWVYEAFGQCIGDLKQWFAFWIGLSSILCWMMAQIPQLVTNCYTGKADQVLSLWFLLQWIIGDSTNLLGAILTDQLFTQLATAVYFVIIDCVTITQFVYYLIRNQGLKGLQSCFRDKPQVVAGLLPGVAFTLLLVSTSPALWGDPYQLGPRTGRTLQQVDFIEVVDLSDTKGVIGYVLGCISATFYLMSRLPQIVKNCRRCSVEGLSPIMFVLAIMGNATYGLSIFLYSVEPVFLLQRLPWLVGSVGTFVFDFIIMGQFVASWVAKCKHRHRHQHVKKLDVEKDPLLPSAPAVDCWKSVFKSDNNASSNYSIRYYKSSSNTERKDSWLYTETESDA